jgi:4-hydroxybenzoate polyprenyltransferase
LSLLYFILNYFYSLIGKQIRFFDILVLCSFYIIRVFYGASITAVPLTGWFVATLTLSVLSLSIHKRYMECKISTRDVIPGRGYTKYHIQFLQILMINFALAAIVLLNIHAYFVLNITTPVFFVLLNLISASIMLLYFDDATDNSDDPVTRVIGNKKLLFSLTVFVILYFFEMVTKK